MPRLLRTSSRLNCSASSASFPLLLPLLHFTSHSTEVMSDDVVYCCGEIGIRDRTVELEMQRPQMGEDNNKVFDKCPVLSTLSPHLSRQLTHIFIVIHLQNLPTDFLIVVIIYYLELAWLNYPSS